MISVAICCPLCNYDFALAEVLSRFGLDCTIVRHQNHPQPDPRILPGSLRSFSPDFGKVVRVASPLETWRVLRRADVIVNGTNTISSCFGKMWPVSSLIPLPPIVNVATGSDITELAVTRGLVGAVYRAFLRKGAVNVLPPYPLALRNAQKLGFGNFRVVRYPYLVAPFSSHARPAGTTIRYLLASHLDWGHCDGRARQSTKGNDRFLRAMIRAIQAGGDVRCVVLDRGPDRAEARRIIAESGVADRFEILPPTTQAGLLGLIRDCDVVADQFDLGGFGAYAMEAMAQAKPVMIYIDPESHAGLYHKPMPILNCQTEDQIFEQIMSWRDLERLRALGESARLWVEEHHSAAFGDFADFVELIRQTAERAR